MTLPRRSSGEQPNQSAMRSVTPRILVLGVILIFVNCYWVIEVEGIWHSNHATAMSLFWNTVFFLLILVLINVFALKPLARRVSASGRRGLKVLRPFSQG